MINRKPVLNENDPNFTQCWNLYCAAFPAHERRPFDYHIETLKKAAFNFEAVFDDTNFIGIISWWNLPNFRYIEHFAVSPDSRNFGYGKLILQNFVNESEKPILLEVEKPDNEIQKRRIDFYERFGFKLNHSEYAHPPYSGDEWVDLFVMTHPNEISETELMHFKNESFPTIHFRHKFFE